MFSITRQYIRQCTNFDLGLRLLHDPGPRSARLSDITFIHQDEGQKILLLYSA